MTVNFKTLRLAILSGLLAHTALGAELNSATSTSFQGVLNGPNGQPLANGSYNLTFRFYTNAATAVALGVTNVSNVPVSGGVASTAIPVEPAWFQGQDLNQPTLYLGISVNGTQELTPRMLMTSVPFAQTITSGQVSGKLIATDKFTAGTDYRETTGGFNNDFAFIGNRVRGTIDNWVQGFNPDWYPLLGNGHRFAGFGVAEASDCVSPIIWMYGGVSGRSMFQVRSVPFDATKGVRNGIVLMTVVANGRVGIGTDEPQATLHIRGPQGTVPVYDILRTTKANGDIGFSANSDGDVFVGHQLWTPVLHIQGGSDLAEPFDVTPADAQTEIQPGMVMVIDRERDGKLTPCMQAYDTAVAGVLSGANGLQPGMVMQAEGHSHAAGEHPLAMTGRVWCLADAAHGPIQRGDRLTTSPTVGHAMRAAEQERAPGAVIGKAMSELREGQGFVLVLVNLQ